MIFNEKEIAFPAIPKISFFKVIELLEKQAEYPDKNVANYAIELLAECNQYPELREGFEDPEKLITYQDIIGRIASVLFPEALLTNEIKGLIAPFDFSPFYLSTRFQSIIDKAGGEFKFDLKDYNEDLMYIYGASAILGSYYGFPTSPSAPSFIEIEDKKAKVIRSYRMAFNADLIEMVATSDAPAITEDDHKELLDDYFNIDLWKEKFPPNSYIMRGVGVINLMDVTVDRSMERLTSNLMNKSQSSFERIVQSMRDMFGIRDLQGGFIMFENGILSSAKAHKKGLQSFALEGETEIPSEGNMCGLMHSQLLVNKKPLIVTDVDNFEKFSKSTISQTLQKNKAIGSYIMAPLINDGEFLGFLELVSPRKYELNGSSIPHLDNVLPILSMAIARFKREEQNELEAIIQQECTTIHPSVKWRFDEEAAAYMKSQYANEQPVFKDIVFNDVYPLYGQLDIKGSSEKRNDAIKGDLLNHIKGIRKVISGALKITKMPVYEELVFRLDEHRDEIRSKVSSGSEQRIQSFLNSEINPILGRLKKDGGELAASVKKYEDTLDSELNTIYELRKNFDTSVNLINQTLASLLDQKQEEAQNMFPHYFERYKTDGVEYNMYIGQSIAGGAEFDPVFLSNLRLWQLIVTCELENRFEHLKKEIDAKLEIASLILVYSNSLAVHFRMDEKRFDVEGAYNARYEVVKKRVDKAHIKGTKERITSPGKIAIIYASEQDAEEYRKYIKFLQTKGHLKKDAVENLELEDLQGISGLKALRVQVNYKSNPIDTNFSVDKLLEGINGN